MRHVHCGRNIILILLKVVTRNTLVFSSRITMYFTTHVERCRLIRNFHLQSTILDTTLLCYTTIIITTTIFIIIVTNIYYYITVTIAILLSYYRYYYTSHCCNVTVIRRDEMSEALLSAHPPFVLIELYLSCPAISKTNRPRKCKPNVYTGNMFRYIIHSRYTRYYL